MGEKFVCTLFTSDNDTHPLLKVSNLLKILKIIKRKANRNEKREI